MTQTTTITPARQAILEFIKSNISNRCSTSSNSSRNSKSSSRSNSSSNSSGGDNDRSKKKKKKKSKFDTPNQHDFKKELDQKRRSAYIVRLGGKMI